MSAPSAGFSDAYRSMLHMLSSAPGHSRLAAVTRRAKRSESRRRVTCLGVASTAPSSPFRRGLYSPDAIPLTADMLGRPTVAVKSLAIIGYHLRLFRHARLASVLSTSRAIERGLCVLLLVLVLPLVRRELPILLADFPRSRRASRSARGAGGSRPRGSLLLSSHAPCCAPVRAWP
jgi:hypothetical protein